MRLKYETYKEECCEQGLKFSGNLASVQIPAPETLHSTTA